MINRQFEFWKNFFVFNRGGIQPRLSLDKGVRPNWKNLEYYDGFRLEESLLKAYFEIFLDVNDKQAYSFLEGPTKLEALRFGK